MVPLCEARILIFMKGNILPYNANFLSSAVWRIRNDTQIGIFDFFSIFPYRQNSLSSHLSYRKNGDDI